MENFTIADNITFATVDNITTTLVNNITSTFISILTTEMELNTTDDGTTENLAQVLTSSLTSTESPAATITSILTTTTTSMEDIETTTGNDLHLWKRSGKFSHSHLPGKLEAAIIICFVGLVLFLAAKYIGCKPSYFCCTFDSFKSHPRTDSNNPSFIRHENILQRPEYNRPLQYAVYSRPGTANINQMSTVDARGYGYSGFDDEEPQVKFTRGGEDHIIDPPPEYDSLVPPGYSNAARPKTAYGTGNAPAYYTYETSRNIGDVRL